jgi:hypothetical protein
MTAPKGYEQHEEEMDIPKGSGAEGFLRAIKDILKLPRVQEIHIDARGKISYTFFLREGETKRVATPKFEDLMPFAIVRNAKVVEVDVSEKEKAGAALAHLFRAPAIDHMFPVAFVVGASTTFWEWYEYSFGMKADFQEELFSLPVHSDRMAPDDVILLCAAFSRNRDLAETQKVYKLLIPKVPK